MCECEDVCVCGGGGRGRREEVGGGSERVKESDQE